jgi:hypothetical protein
VHCMASAISRLVSVCCVIGNGGSDCGAIFVLSLVLPAFVPKGTSGGAPFVRPSGDVSSSLMSTKFESQRGLRWDLSRRWTDGRPAVLNTVLDGAMFRGPILVGT